MKKFVIGFIAFLLAIGFFAFRKQHGAAWDRDETSVGDFLKANRSLDKSLKLPRGM